MGKRRSPSRTLPPISPRRLDRLNEHDVYYHDWPPETVETGQYGVGPLRGLWRRTVQEFPSRCGPKLYRFTDFEQVGGLGPTWLKNSLSKVVFEGSDEDLLSYAMQLLDSRGLPNGKDYCWLWQSDDGTLRWSRNESDLPSRYSANCAPRECNANEIAFLWNELTPDIAWLFLEQNPNLFQEYYAAKYISILEDIRVSEDRHNYEDCIDRELLKYTDRIRTERLDFIEAGHASRELADKIIKILHDLEERAEDHGQTVARKERVRLEWQMAILHHGPLEHDRKRREAVSHQVNEANQTRKAQAKQWHSGVIAWAKSNRPNAATLRSVATACIKALKLPLATGTVADYLGKNRARWQSKGVQSAVHSLAKTDSSDHLHSDRTD